MDVFHRNLRSRKNVLGFTTDMSTEVDHGSTSDLLLLAERSVLHMLFLFFFGSRLGTPLRRALWVRTWCSCRLGISCFGGQVIFCSGVY